MSNPPLQTLQELRLPEPSKPPGRAPLKLLETAPQTYVDTTVRVVMYRAREKEDELGSRPYIFGIAEDATFKAPFICYKPYPFFQDSVFKFHNAYIHLLNDNSILLILTEHSKIEYLTEEDPRDYVWQPKIGRISRPLGSCQVTLQGIVSSVYQSSGLVKRCEECNRVIFNEACPSGHEKGWRWGIRISGRMSDETGSINTFFSQYLTCKLLGRPISEALYMANVPEGANSRDFNVESFQVGVPKELPINEAVVVEPDLFRQCKHVIVPDHKLSRIYCPKNVKVVSNQILEVKDRVLKWSNEGDRDLLKRIFEKALDFQVRKRTGLPKLHGIYLTEEPMPLYWAERAKLFLGFETNVSVNPNFLNVDVYPNALVRESVLDYIQWRRDRGASVKGIEKTLTKWRQNVILAPNGTIGRLCRFIYQDAGDFLVPGFNASLPEFWENVYDVKVKPGERPLLVVKPYSLDVELTYPPSCVFMDEQTIFLRSSVLGFIDYKKSTLRRTAPAIVLNALKDLKIGEYRVEVDGETKTRLDAQRLILHDIKEKLLGRMVKATGSVIQANNSLYFLPKTVSGVS
jgi:hypothetical protein